MLPSTWALDFELQHMVFCTEFLDGWWSWELLRRSCERCGWCLHLLPRFPVTSIPPFIFPSITRCRRQFLRKMWPIQLAFRLLISRRIFLCSLTLSNASSFLTRSVQLILSILLQHHVSKHSRCFWSTARSVQVSAPYKAMLRMCSLNMAFIQKLEHVVDLIIF